MITLKPGIYKVSLRRELGAGKWLNLPQDPSSKLRETTLKRLGAVDKKYHGTV
jgi:hypothetical protein